MRYILIEFTCGLECQAYQEISDSGQVLRYCDLDGNTLVLPAVTESRVIDDNPEQPVWANV